MKPFPTNLLTKNEHRVFKKLSTPAKIQDFLDTIAINFEPAGDTCRSPREVLTHQSAHCIEGALFAAAALWYHGKRPLLLDLKSASHDYDHVVTLFQENGYWGAISKTNHAVLRYREPVYKTVRELALSFFHEYFDDTGRKSLRSFSRPFSLLRYDPSWITDTEDLWEIGADLDDAPHETMVTPAMARKLRKAHPLEIAAGKLTEYSS